ncbi:MAG: DUF5658 family protein [Armatimonadota bacterium]
MMILKKQVCVESVVLAAICIADMLITLYYVMIGVATEQNPIMAAAINHSPETFVIVKMASFVPFIAAVEYYRRKQPDFAIKASRLAIGLYLAVYIVFTVGVNV